MSSVPVRNLEVSQSICMVLFHDVLTLLKLTVDDIIIWRSFFFDKQIGKTAEMVDSQWNWEKKRLEINHLDFFPLIIDIVNLKLAYKMF